MEPTLFTPIVHYLPMKSQIQVALLTSDEWSRLRDLRLRSLLDSPDAFGGTLETEKSFSEEDWRSKFITLDYLVASLDSQDIAIMSVEVLHGDHGATCWIGGCWSDPLFRGQGAFRALFAYVDKHCLSKGWQRQGLGVWTDNYAAIAAYKALGFVEAGEKKASERQPGRFYMHMVRDSE
ncbi:unannotated protein [freshwater metagenome]|uniref:Unannotated protein n=1 Tax=freshwater metagenome TaxID=449393 RepID=A0A6J7QHI0_9ZZZZ